MRTQCVGENLDLLLVAHFPNLVVTDVVEAPATAPNVWTGRWMRGLSLIGDWNGQFNSFTPYKSPGMGGIFPALQEEGQMTVVPYLVKILHASLATG